MGGRAKGSRGAHVLSEGVRWCSVLTVGQAVHFFQEKPEIQILLKKALFPDSKMWPMKVTV